MSVLFRVSGTAQATDMTRVQQVLTQLPGVQEVHIDRLNALGWAVFRSQSLQDAVAVAQAAVEHELRIRVILDQSEWEAERLYSATRMWREAFFLCVGIFCSLPLLAAVIADFLGYRVFYLADPALQFIYATGALLAIGLSLSAKAWRRRCIGRVHPDLLPLLAVGSTYAYSVYNTWIGAPGAIYVTVAALAALVGLRRLCREIATNRRLLHVTGSPRDDAAVRGRDGESPGE